MLMELEMKWDIKNQVKYKIKKYKLRIYIWR